jgi:OmcA/MtrC family decaheme c-type cytochrome
MSGADLIVEFGIWKKVSPSSDESLVTFVAPAASFPDLRPSNPRVTGGPLQPEFGNTPSFLLPYAQKQDEITTPADYNNLGKAQAQPRTVSIRDCLDTTKAGTCTVVPSATNTGYYTATIKSAYPTTPTPAVMRAVALQGYFEQVTAPASLTAPNGRHAISVIKPVSGDTERRTVVDAKKCSGCHEWIEAHGGNRVAEPQVCVACHVPGMATSGRGIADTTLNVFNFSIAQTKILTDWKFDKTAVNAALKFPVTSNNFKDMIHGIHAGRDRVTPFQDARDSTSRGSIDLLDFRRMDFPGKLENCETCHVTATGTTATYNTIPSGSLASTYESINTAYAAAILAGTATPKNASDSLRLSPYAHPTDSVTTPFAAACVSCHDKTAAKAHIAINGGQLNVTRSAALPAGRALEDVESCAVCHGPGRDFDTAKVHK